jgi:hypothetical protein
VHVEVPHKKQKENSKDLLLLKKTFLKWLDSGNSLSELKTDENQKVIKGKLLEFMINTLEIDAWVCELLDKENYYEVSYKFIERAKELIEGISFEDIFQALRNIWVIVALQIYMDEEVRLTDAMFAYSMLYPLTDNYLDNPKIPINDKKSFNDRFWQKISDNIDKPLNDLEKRIFSMIDLIENDFPRTEYPNVFKGLLTILDGQQKSLLQHKANDLSDSDLLMYTFYKGGASVLADAFLVRGELTDDEASFAYAYGIILQLADDLQDLCEDLKNHHVTPYNRRSGEDSLDNFFNKHQNYTLHFLTNTFQTSTDKQRAIKQLLDKSLELLLFGGVCDNRKCFSSSFIKQFMKRSRFSCRSFKKLNSKIEKKIKL